MARSYTYRHPRPSLAVDVAVLCVHEGRLEVLLIRRKAGPFQGAWALPGGFVNVSDHQDQGEALDRAAARELCEETTLDVDRAGVYLEQLYTFGAPGRDPRGRVISVVYLALLPGGPRPAVRGRDDADEARWFDLNQVLDASAVVLAFDHPQILSMARERMRGKIDWVPEIAARLAPAAFTQNELRTVYAAVKGQAQDRSNFAKRFKRLLDEGSFAPVERTKVLRGPGRPPKLYALSAAQNG